VEKGTGVEAAVEPPSTLSRAVPNGDTSGHRRTSLQQFSREELVEDFRLACVSRALDDREILLQKQSRVFFQISGAGHEVLLVALARSLRPAYDWFFPYYRDRALVLALGVSPRAIMLQATGSAEDPASGGRQMPCHWGDVSRNIVTQSSPTGSQCLPAVGCAEAGRYIARHHGLPGCSANGDEVTYVSLGEGTTSQGEFWESLNTACRLHLPVLYVVADNGFAISVRAEDQAPAPISEMVRGFRGLAVTHMDGWDYATCRVRGAKAIARVRAGEGPHLIHARVTRPYSHSSADSQAKYRDAAELAEEAAHDPVATFEKMLIHARVLTPEEAADIRAEAKDTATRAGDEALAAARPDPATVTDHVVRLAVLPTPEADPEPELSTTRWMQEESSSASAAAPSSDELQSPEEQQSPEELQSPEEAQSSDTPIEPTAAAVAPGGAGRDRLIMADAIRATLNELMEADDRIRVFGEDVADADERVLDHVEGKGGVFGVTRGLQRRFGSSRCYNTPLAEANIVGRGVGQALRGLKPCPEIQFFDYIWPAMVQLRSEAATIRWRSNGAFSCPLVVRVAIGGYLTGGAIWHSQSGESIFAHIPGLLVAFPSRARDAVGLLRAAFASDDPVLFLEHKHLYRQRYAADPMPHLGWMLPFGQGAVVRPGRDLTIVTWGATVQKSLEAARQLQDEGCSVEVVDLRSINPWDRTLVCESVDRTGRLLVVHEDTLTAGFGAEVTAWVAEHCFWSLDAPVARVTATDTFVAYEPTLERAILPQVDDITTSARALVHL
jgi:2-oxoisovalerate dehydrogenase E1 component